ncbi:MAG: hypothetical protein AB7T06_19295 [Kofleriaceae bacterium]
MIRAVAIAVALAACGGTQKTSGVDRDDAIVKLASNVTDAQLYVDGQFIGPLGALRGGVAVEPGTHRFELRHDDYFSSYLELTLAKAERRQVALDMAPVLP